MSRKKDSSFRRVRAITLYFKNHQTAAGKCCDGRRTIRSSGQILAPSLRSAAAVCRSAQAFGRSRNDMKADSKFTLRLFAVVLPVILMACSAESKKTITVTPDQNAILEQVKSKASTIVVGQI